MDNTFSISIGKSDFGWCDYGIRINEKMWEIQASYLSKHPLHDHIHTAVDLYDCIINGPFPKKNELVWDCFATDEPGKLQLKINIINNYLNINIHHCDVELSLCSINFEKSLVAKNIKIELMVYIQSVVYATAYVINSQGIMGLTEAFGTESSWGIDGHTEIIPFHLFLYLATIVKYGEPKTQIGLQEEFELIKEMAARYKI